MKKSRTFYFLLSYMNGRVNNEKIAKNIGKNENVTSQGGVSISSMKRLHGLQDFKAYPFKGDIEMATSKQDSKTAGKQSGKPERGFAAMNPERQREIAREGGRAAHLSGNAHEFTSEEARAAGRKGGQASSKRR